MSVLTEDHKLVPYLFWFCILQGVQWANRQLCSYCSGGHSEARTREFTKVEGGAEGTPRSSGWVANGPVWNDLNHRLTRILLLELGSSVVPNCPLLTSLHNPLVASLTTFSFHSLTRLGIQGGRGRVEGESQEGAGGVARASEWADGEEQGQQQVRVWP